MSFLYQCPVCTNEYSTDDNPQNCAAIKAHAKRRDTSDAAKVALLRDALTKARCAIQGYKDTNRMAEDSVLNRALIAAKEALAATK